ncbi:MAG: T9SS type A sorting domain-containing protein [Bacteroidia bacterium]
MRKILLFIGIFYLSAIAKDSFSQRYLTEVFPLVTKTSDVIYGNNISVMTGAPAASDLKMDVYQPSGDVLTERPLVIVLHTGSFLPPILNGQPTGSKNDSAVIEMCTRFAKKGYVAVAADYRLGWNPISTDVDVRTGTLLNAVYRAIQDTKNCVRFFKNDRATTNAYKIDTTRIVVGGISTGGYISLAYASLNQPSEIQLAKFIDNSKTPPVPYVNQALSGNFDGTDATQLNRSNYPSHNSKINMVFNVGGAIGDTSWIQAGEVPIISMHCTKDPFAPYKTGAVVVPTTGDFVVEASGSYDVIRTVNKAAINNNAIFKNSLFNDVYTMRANQLNNGSEGLFPFIMPAPGVALPCGAQIEQGFPWDWWDQAAFIAQYNAATSTTNGAGANCKQLIGNPDMSAAKARKYIDSIQGYVCPRMVCALNLPGCVPNGIKEYGDQSKVSVYPNPSTTEINFSVEGANTIKNIRLYSITGSLLFNVNGLNNNTYKLNRQTLPSGLYFLTIDLRDKASITKKIILE